MPAKGTTDGFIEKALKIHGNKYDYSLVDYTYAYNPVKIICKEHGAFSQIASRHLQGFGCWGCAVEVRAKGLSKGAVKFISQATEVHGSTYNYSNVVYKNSDTYVTILCKEHGAFNQLPRVHLNGSGCPLCGLERETRVRPIPTTDFLLLAHQVHNGKYNYEESVDDFNIMVYCHKHGWSEQVKKRHLKTAGCRKCSKNNHGDTESFIKKATKVHGDRYDYSVTSYVSAKTNVQIRCKEHDSVFTMTPNKHLSLKRGCPLCNNQKQHTHLFIYLLESESMVKIGITSDLKERVRGINGEAPETFSVVSSYILPTKTIRWLERFILKMLWKRGFAQPTEQFVGMTECFLKSSLSLYRAEIIFDSLCGIGDQSRMITVQQKLWYHEELRRRGFIGQFLLQQYLEQLSQETGVDISRIRSIIMALGIEELFTGVVKAVEEFAKTGRVEFN